LAPNATSADVHVLIYERYAGLVRQGSAFWDTSGVNVHGSLLKGIDVDIESLRAIATGGIEFATPSATAPRAKPGTVFFLYDKPKEEWLSWLPRIALPPQQNSRLQNFVARCMAGRAAISFAQRSRFGMPSHRSGKAPLVRPQPA